MGIIIKIPAPIGINHACVCTVLKHAPDRLGVDVCRCSELEMECCFVKSCGSSVENLSRLTDPVYHIKLL